MKTTADSDVIPAQAGIQQKRDWYRSAKGGLYLSPFLPWLRCAAAIVTVIFALAILFPAASTARSGGKSTLCLANLHILGQAWTTYPDDHDGRIVGGSTYYGSGGGTPWRWVEWPLYSPDDNPAAPPDGMNSPVPSMGEWKQDYFINGIKAGELYPYVNTTAPYHCPFDRYYLAHPDKNFRSYDIAGLMNSEDFTQRTGWPGTITGYRPMRLPDGRNLPLICVERSSQIVHPSEKYTFVEEDDSFGGGFIIMDHGSPDYWWDWPGAIHGGDDNAFGFADGHVETRHWVDPRTIQLIKYGNNSQPGGISEYQPNNPDLQWMVNGYLAGE